MTKTITIQRERKSVEDVILTQGEADEVIVDRIRQHCFGILDDLRVVMKELVEEETSTRWFRLADLMGNLEHQQNTLITFGGNTSQIYCEQMVKEKKKKSKKKT